MRAVLVDPSLPGKLALREVAAPMPSPGECVVRLAAFSLNLGEVRRALTEAAAGFRPGWDIAGTVETPAADGSGPPQGARVVAYRESGGWAEQVAVSSLDLAVIPEGVSLVQAATLPVAGLTALYALDQGGSLSGRKVLINGASGGVGHLACQIAHHAGAEVVANVRRAAQAAQAKTDGADHVVVSDDLAAAKAHAPYDLILESVGGAALSTALTLLGYGGTCVTFGNSLRAPSSFSASDFFRIGAPRLFGLYIIETMRREPAGDGLRRLLTLTQSGRLKPRIEIEAPWEQVGDIAAKLYDRKITGKAVLTL